jgi:hypothetical protein
MTEQPKKSGHGCFFYGAIVAGVLLLMVVLTGYFGYRYAKNKINEFTDTQPMTLPVVQISEADLQRLQERINSFSKAVDEGKPVEAFSITADEVNALIATDPDLAALKGRIYVSFENDEVKAQVSLPADQVGLSPLRGRYINAAGTFGVSLHEGLLQVNVESLSAKGKPIPENILRHIRIGAQTMVLQWTEDPKIKTALGKLQEIQVKDGKLIITPKRH